MNSTPDNQAEGSQNPSQPADADKGPDSPIVQRRFFGRPRLNFKLKINHEDIRKDIEAAMPVVKDRAEQASELLQHGLRKVVPLRSDNPETRYFKILGISFVGLMLVAVLAGVATLLLTLRNPESVAVPRVTGMELPEAMDALQEFGLVARLEQRYFADPGSKGKIMEQTPAAATAVRVGRDVIIVLSKGAMVDKIGNYVGRNVEEVKEEVRSLFNTENPFLTLGEVAYAFDPADAGTIISQDPPPGTGLGKPIALALLVSRGKDATLKDAPPVLGLAWQTAINELIKSDIPFDCVLGEVGAEAAAGTVLAQEPGAAQQLKAGQKLLLTLAPPDSAGTGQVFGIYQGALAEYAVPVEVTASTVSVTGTSRVLWKFNHPGGSLSFPYLGEVGAELVITVFDKEVDRRVISQPQ